VGLSFLKVSYKQLRRNLGEENLYPYHDQTAKPRAPADFAQLLLLDQSILSIKAPFYSQVTSISRDRTNNTLYSYLCSHESPHE
jgi:hypothetical protein